MISNSAAHLSYFILSEKSRKFVKYQREENRCKSVLGNENYSTVNYVFLAGKIYWNI